MATQKAINVAVVLFRADCPCGGGVFNTDTHSYDLTADGYNLQCDTCDSKVVLRRRTASF